MELNASIEALAALANAGRMAIFRLLVRRHPQALQPSEIADCLQMRRNTLSTHLTVLKRAGLLQAERDGRAVYCRIDVNTVADFIRYITADCCRGRPDLCDWLPVQDEDAVAPLTSGGRPLNVLFVCTRNSARSIFAEAILRRDGGTAFRAFSAGTQPQSRVSPKAKALLRRLNFPVESLRSKPIDLFRGSDAPQLDFVFTVCDRAANEDCPPWPGAALTAHWGIPDPVEAMPARGRNATTYRQAYDLVEARVSAFLALPLRSLDRRTLQERLDDIGRL